MLLSNDGVRGVMNANATSVSMMTLLALGTFVAGVQARVYRGYGRFVRLALCCSWPWLARSVAYALGGGDLRDCSARCAGLVG